MLETQFSKEATKEFKSLQPKIKRQVAERILELQDNPNAPGSKNLKGKLSRYWSYPAGEFRICYRFDSQKLYIEAIDKRNDDEIYKRLLRKL